MNLQQLNPWNWFKHEENQANSTIPVKRYRSSDRSNDIEPKVASNTHQWPIQKLQQEIDQLFDQAFRSIGFPSSYSGLLNDGLSRTGFNARLNVASDENHYHISVEAPGLTEKDVVLELNQNALVIRGEKKEQNETKDRHYYRMEHSYGSFQRVLNLPDDCDQEAIAANMKNGVLEINIPRKPASVTSSKRIPIN